jgi:PAS domain S-box-containing protein
LDSARTILVVGTSESRRARSVELLTKAGHNIVAVSTTAEAVAFVASAAPPLVVIDFDPRDEEAMSVCRRVKDQYPNTFILQISPRIVGPDEPPVDIEPCIDAYLVDPIDPQEMLVLVRSLLRLQKVESDLRDSEDRLLLAQESAGLAILDWVIPSNTFIHSDNFADLFDLAPRDADVPLSPAMLLERIHPEDLDALLGEFSEQSLSARDIDKEFRIICRDGTIRWIAARGRMFSGPGGTPERMLSLNFDITRHKLAERANAELASIVASSIDAIVGLDLEARVTSWNIGAQRLFNASADLMIGRPLAEALSGLTSEQIDGFRERLTDEDPHEFETRQTLKDGRVVDMWVTSAPLRARNSQIIGSSLIIRDVSQQKQREEHVRFLMRELTHRSKNLLAVIQAMARQSLTRDITPAEFVRRFSERLAGLAGSHDLLSRVDWKGASLMELIRSQLNHYMDMFGTRILMDGIDVMIRPEAAQNIGIALHELSTNAAKYGALSNDEGVVTIGWSLIQGADRTLVLTWRETGGPPVEPPTRKGFGHVVMDRIAGRALGGHSQVSFEPTGVVWTLDVPASAAVMD